MSEETIKNWNDVRMQFYSIEYYSKKEYGVKGIDVHRRILVEAIHSIVGDPKKREKILRGWWRGIFSRDNLYKLDRGYARTCDLDGKTPPLSLAADNILNLETLVRSLHLPFSNAEVIVPQKNKHLNRDS